MSKMVAIREDYDAASRRSLVRRSRHAAQFRRPLAFAAIYDGTRRGEDAARATADLRTRSACMEPDQRNSMVNHVPWIAHYKIISINRL